MQSFHANWDQVQAQLAKDQVAVQNAQNTLDNPNASLAAAQKSADQANQGDSVSVQNAQTNLTSGQAALSAAQPQITPAHQADHVAVPHADRVLANSPPPPR